MKATGWQKWAIIIWLASLLIPMLVGIVALAVSIGSTWLQILLLVALVILAVKIYAWGRSALG